MTNVWMDARERTMVEKYLNPEAVMFEWGSGGSTSHFSKLVKHLYSVEHHAGWVAQVSEDLVQQNITNVTLYHKKGEPGQEPYHQSTYEDYREYVDAIKIPNTKFDVIFIDGRARRLCALKAIEYLTESGVVVMHDWCTRPPYWCVLDYYDLIEKVDDTPQTIAIFKPKPDWKTLKGYTLDLGSFERLEG